MRYIRTANQIVEFIETDNSDKILSSRGFNLGELYYQIKNNKVTFYLKDNENPYTNDVWSIDIPFKIDDETYGTADEASAALSKLMVLDDLSQIREDLDNEILRSTNKDSEHDASISALTTSLQNEIQNRINNDNLIQRNLDNEHNRAISAETEIANNLDAEVARALSAETRLEDKIDNEVARAIAKENAILNKANLNSERISGLSDAVAVEIQNRINDDSILQTNLTNEHNRAVSAETALHDEILDVESKVNGEILRSTAKDIEHDNAISGLSEDLHGFSGDALSRIETVQNNLDDYSANANNTFATKSALNDEITRSTAKDIEHDNLIADLTDSVRAEETRAIARENELNAKIDTEILNRISGDTRLDDKIDAENARAIAKENEINSKTDAEVTRSTAKDIEHDEKILALQGADEVLTQDLNTEIQRASAAESSLHNEILDEKNRAITAETSLRNDLNAEITRANAEETRIEGLIVNEITRSTNKDTEYDLLIDGLGDDIAVERERAMNAESGISNALNAETSRAKAEEARLDGKIDNVSVNTYNKSEIDNKLDVKADKANAVASAEYNSRNKIINFKNINGTVISTIDATDFVKDGMVKNVFIKVIDGKSYLAITFNTDAGHEEIVIPLTDIFNANNFYTKAEVDASQAAQDTNINRISGDVTTLNNEVRNITGNFASKEYVSNYTYDKSTIDRKVTESGTFDPTQYYNKADTNALLAGKAGTATTYTKSEVDSSQALQNFKIDKISGDVSTLSNSFASKEYVSNYTYDKSTIDQKVAEGGTFDPTQYYKKSETSGATQIATALNAKADKSDIADMASKTWVNGQGFLKEHQSLEGYATEAWVNASQALQDTEIAKKLDASAYTPSDLSEYYKKSETSGKTEIQDALNLKADKSDIADMASKTWVNGQGFLKEHQSLDGYVTDNELSAYTYDKAEIDEKIAEGGIFDPTQYYTTANTYSKTEANNLLAQKQNELTAGANVQINGNVISATDTKYTAGSGISIVNNVISAVGGESGVDAYTKEESDARYYTKQNTYTKTEVDNLIPSLTGYATQSWVNSQGFLKEHQDLTNYATKTWVQGQGYLTEHQSLANYALKSEIPDISGLASETYVKNYTYDKSEIDRKVAEGGTFDPTQYYNKTATDALLASKADTATTYTKSQVDTALGEKQNTLVSSQNIKTINGETLLGSGNIEIQGGGKAVSAGTNISITTGETADTINCTLSGGTLINISNNKINCSAPIKHGTGIGGVIVGSSVSTNKASGQDSIANGGDANTASGQYSYAEGFGTKATKVSSHSEGWFTQASGDYSHTEGNHTNATNESEHASGRYNVSSSASTTFGDSGNTLFSVGNGTADNARHNAFEVRQNGDIYITKDGADVKLQDQLGGKADTTAFTAHTADTVIHVTSAEKAAWNAKSDFSGDYNDLTNKPTIPTVPTSNTAFTNDAGYATTGDVQTATADMATKTWVGNQGYLTEHQSLSNYYTKSETSGATEIATALNGKADKSEIADMASKTWVQGQGYLTEHQSLDNYYTKTETDNKYFLKTNIWCGTEEDYNAIITKDPETIYLIHE